MGFNSGFKGLKILSLPSFALKSPKIIFMSYLGNWSDTYRYNYSQKLTSESSLLFSSEACVFRTISHQQPLATTPDTLPPTKTNISKCSYNFPTHKTILFHIYDINSLVHKKVLFPAGPMSRVPSNFLYYHQMESILGQFIAPLFRDIRPERLLTFKLINITSILNCLDLLKQFVQVRGPVWHFETWYNSPKPQPWNTTPCRLPATTYSVYSQLPSISDDHSPTYATLGRAMPWWRTST